MYGACEKVRLDKFLAARYPEFTRSCIKNFINDGSVLVNGKCVKVGHLLKFRDSIDVNLKPPKIFGVSGENVSLDIIYEDDFLIVINKPRGMVVHPAPGNENGTLVNALVGYLGEKLSSINGVLRPGIVHRIDKDTTGVILVAKDDHAHRVLQQRIQDYKIKREYLAIVHGKTYDQVINKPIGRSKRDRKKMAVSYENSRFAITNLHVLEYFEKYSYIKLKLETGRTHQIRVHMASIGHHVVGDFTYGVKREEFSLTGQLLHAYRLCFDHPIYGNKIECECEPPEDFCRILSLLRLRNSNNC